MTMLHYLPNPVTIILAILIFVPLEQVLALRENQKIFRAKWKLDTIYLVINGVLVGIGLNATVLAIILVSSHFVPDGLHDWVASQPVWLQFPVLLLLADLGFYLAHRMFHTFPSMWKFHAVHHSIEEMDWLAAHRVHPIDQIITKTASLLPIALLGFSAGPVALYAILYQWQSLFVHSNTRIKLGFLEYLLATPHFHHWHHAEDREGWDKNFAGQLPFLDKLFGTFHMPEGRMPKAYGVSDPVPATYPEQLAYPFRAEPARQSEQPAR